MDQFQPSKRMLEILFVSNSQCWWMC
jgi:hypothetical protein